jgi:hypothetical protein
VDLMSIGEFARLSRLSAKAPRLYDEQEVWDLGKEVIGMLKAPPPPRVDGVAGAAFRVRDWPDQAASLVENGGYSDASG